MESGLIPARAMIAAIALAMIGAPGHPAPADSYCDPSLARRVDAPLGYRDRGDRCEGLYVKEVGADTVIASFTEAFESYDLTRNSPLRVEWDPTNERVALRARSLRRRLYYRMDTRALEGRHVFDWPLTILAALELRHTDIGIVGTIRRGIGGTPRDVLVPLRIRQGASGSRSGVYRVVLLSGVEMAEVFVTLVLLGSDGNAREVVKNGEALRHGYYPAERAIEFAVTGLRASGVYRLEVGGRLRNGGTTTLQAWFSHSTS